MGFELAQVNIARMRAPFDDPAMQGFIAALDPVHRLAQDSPGFVWQLSSGHAHPVTRSDGPATLVVNLSVWTSYESLHAFVYRSAHGGFVRRRAEWFVRSPWPTTALWWVPAGHRPTADDGMRRLAVLRQDGPTPRAFHPRRRFGPDGRPVGRAATPSAASTVRGRRH